MFEGHSENSFSSLASLVAIQHERCNCNTGSDTKRNFRCTFSSVFMNERWCACYLEHNVWACDDEQVRGGFCMTSAASCQLLDTSLRSNKARESEEEQTSLEDVPRAQTHTKEQHDESKTNGMARMPSINLKLPS